MHSGRKPPPGRRHTRAGVQQPRMLAGRTHSTSPTYKAIKQDATSPPCPPAGRYPIKADGTLDAAGRGLAYDFGAAEGKGNIDIDGMRLDTAGALHVTRHNGGEVVVIDPMATNKALRRIPLPFSSPANLEFGGPDGKTLFVVGRCGVGTPWGTGNGCVEALRVGAPGLYWQGLQQGLPKVQT